MALELLEAVLPSPTPISVHDDRDVPGQILGSYRERLDGVGDFTSRSGGRRFRAGGFVSRLQIPVDDRRSVGRPGDGASH
jgi:hypothetical protein